MNGNLETVKILAIDSSSLSGSVALCRGEVVVAESFLNIQSTHSEKLLKQVDLLLAETGWALEDLDLLAAVTGPGSFTGLRIGIALVKGLGQVLNRPVAAISSLRAVALNVPLVSQPICVLLDARKKEVYTQRFEWRAGTLVALDEARVVAPLKALDALSEETILVGSGVPVYRDLIRSTLGTGALVAPTAAHQIRGAQVASAALDDWLSGRTMAPADMVPSYIRPSDAELNSA